MMKLQQFLIPWDNTSGGNMRKFLPFLVSGVLMLLIGLYMIIRPETFLTVVIALFGIYEAIDGLRSFIAIRRVNDVFGSVLRTVSYSKSVISMVVGLIVIIIAILAPNLIPTVIIYVIAASFLLAGVVNRIDLFAFSKNGLPFGPLGLETVLSLVFALILFLFPNVLTGIVLTVFAAVIFAGGAVMIYGAISAMIHAGRGNDSSKEIDGNSFQDVD